MKQNDQANPYASPETSDVEANPGHLWHVNGSVLEAKDQSTLPMVDLETGATEHDAPLIVKQHVHQNFGVQQFMTIAVTLALIALLRKHFEPSISGYSLGFFLISFLVGRVAPLLGVNWGKPITFWAFTEQSRAKRAKKRVYLRLLIFFMLLIFVVGVSFSDVPYDAPLLFPSYIICLAIVLSLSIWTALDRHKLKLESFAAGWIRITNIHPIALQQLREIEAKEAMNRATEGATVSRLVRTFFPFRYPLRLLIAETRNPLMILKTLYIKVFFPTNFRFEIYDSSEETVVTIADLSAPLHQACEEWLKEHPDWLTLRATVLISPSANIHKHSAYFVSPDLNHCLVIMRYWFIQNVEVAKNHYCFMSWINEGANCVCTHNRAFLDLNDKNPSHRANGEPEEVYQAHLGHIARHDIFHPEHSDAVLQFLKNQQSEADRLLEKRKILSHASSSNVLA